MKQILFRRCKLDYTSSNGFKYPKEGWVEAKDYNTKRECGGGLHALRAGDDPGLLDPFIEDEGLWQVFTDYEGLIDLGGKVKIQRGYVKTGTDISEYRDEFLKNPVWAYWYALFIDKCARDDTRKAVCGNPKWVYRYARYVDRCTRDDTRKAACGDPEWACMYALFIDECAREDTRKAACRDPEWACAYASDVDECARDDTRKAAYKDIYWKKEYLEWEEGLLNRNEVE